MRLGFVLNLETSKSVTHLLQQDHMEFFPKQSQQLETKHPNPARGVIFILIQTATSHTLYELEMRVESSIIA